MVLELENEILAFCMELGGGGGEGVGGKGSTINSSVIRSL